MAIQQQQKEADPAARQQAASGLAAARGAAPTPGVAPSPEVAPSPQPASVPVLRRYCPHTDHAAVVEICRDVCDVYGGSDDLPQRINEEAARPCTHALALATGGAGAPLDALLCCQLRGDVLWVYGARTRGSLRGLGMASRLLEEAEALAHSLGAAALLSVTVTINGTMQRLFQRRGFVQQCQVVSWPPSAVAHAAHRQLQEISQQQQQQPASLLSVLPAVRAVADSAAARTLLPRWRRCTSAGELAAVLRLLRQRRADAAAAAAATAAGGEAAAAAAVAAPALQYLPGEYECLPVLSIQAQQLVAAGQVWLLEAAAAPEADGGGGLPHELPAAVLVFHGPGHGNVRHAGVVAGSRAALESAVLHGAAVDPALCKFYIDCADRCSHPELWGAAPGEQFHILPYHKPLALRPAGC